MSEGVFCSCGAAWFGKYRAAAQAHVHVNCKQITHGEYKKAHKCRCEECSTERQLARALRKSKAMPTVAEMEEALRLEREFSSHDHSALTAIVERIIEIRKKR